MTPAAPTRRRGERGHVLLLVAVVGLLTMGFWMLAWRATHDAIRVDRYGHQRARRTDSVHEAAALAAERLQSGLPPTDPFSCIATVTDGTTSYDCTVTYSSQQGPPGRWRIESHLSTPEELAVLPAMPPTFGN